jgi:hypothetical protein
VLAPINARRDIMMVVAGAASLVLLALARGRRRGPAAPLDAYSS